MKYIKTNIFKRHIPRYTFRGAELKCLDIWTETLKETGSEGTFIQGQPYNFRFDTLVRNNDVINISSVTGRIYFN